MMQVDAPFPAGNALRNDVADSPFRRLTCGERCRKAWDSSRSGFIPSLRIAQSSLKELQTQLILAVRAGLIGDDLIALVLGQPEGPGKMLHALIHSLEHGKD